MTETTDSPYRPPGSAIVAPPEVLTRYEPTGTFAVSRCVNDAWDAMLRNIGPFLGLLGLIVLAWLAFLLIVGAGAAVLQGSGAGAFFFLMALMLLVAAPVLGWGMLQFSLRAIDGRARIADLFSLFERPVPRFGKLVVLWIVLFAVGLPGSAPQFGLQLSGSTDLSLLGLAYVWNIVWSQLVSIRLFFAMLFVVDRDMGVGEALRTSWDWTRGNTLKFFGLLVVSAGISLAGILALVIGVIPASFIAWLMYPSAFRQIAGGSDAVTGARAA